MTPIIIALTLALAPSQPADRAGGGEERRRCGEYSNCGDHEGDTIIVIDLWRDRDG